MSVPPDVTGAVRPARKLVVTASGAAMAPLARWSVPTHRALAERHGYALAHHRIEDRADRSSLQVRAAKWAKVGLLRAALDDHDVVLWLDVDTVVLRTDRDPLDDLAPGAFQGLVVERFPDRCNPNTGVWLLRRDPRAVAFLDEVLACGQLEHSWADQATVCLMLGWDIGGFHGAGARPGPATAHRLGTAWLPPTWNAVGRAPPPDARIAHVAGLPLRQRADRMARIHRAAHGSALVDSSEGGRPSWHRRCR